MSLMVAVALPGSAGEASSANQTGPSASDETSHSLIMDSQPDINERSSSFGKYCDVCAWFPVVTLTGT